jgi:hypothetical protein
MKGWTKWSALVAASVLIILSCARQDAPTGGKKDFTPPRVTKSNPLFKGLMFKGKRVIISFNEFIALEKPNKIIISPPLAKKPDILVKGKSIDITFKEKLKDSITYTINFQDAVRDLNEGNPIYNFQFTFSTGKTIDSLSVTGNVYNASNLEIPENTLIVLYHSISDSAVAKEIPDYVTLPDKNGGFRISNIRPGTYRIYALQDKNNNKKFDLADEGFAFLDNLIEVTPEKNNIPMPVVLDTSKVRGGKKKPPVLPLIDGEYKLYTFTAPGKSHYLTSADRKNAKMLSFTLSLPPDPMSFSLKIPEAAANSFFIENNHTKDSITVWLTDSLLYSKNSFNTIITYPFTDTTGITKPKTDTIKMTFNQVKPVKGTKQKDLSKKLVFRNSIPPSGQNPGSPVIFTSETPFREPDTSKIRLFRMDKKTQIKEPYSLRKDSVSRRKYILTTKFREGETYLLIADSASFGNIYGAVSDSAGFRFIVRTSDSYSTLTVNITNVTGKTLIQLLDIKEVIVLQKEIYKDGKLVFSMLDPGKYRLRAVKDLNNDGKWTSGDFWNKLQPEPVTYLPADVDMKANFDTDQDWSLKNWFIKNQKQRSSKEAEN